MGRPGSGALPPPTALPLGRAAGAGYSLAVGAVYRRRGPAVLGTFSRAAVLCVLCALPGFAAPDGRCGLAPILVPWFWLAACLSGVPHGPALVHRASSSPVAVGAPVGFPVAVVPSPNPGAVAPGFTGWLRRARGGRPRTGLIVPAPGPCRGKGARRAPRRTRSGTRDGVVPGGSLRLWSWAVRAAVVWRVWTRSLTRPVSCTVRLSTGDSAGALGLFRVDADTSPFGSEDATLGSRARVCVRALLAWVGRAGLPGAFRCASPFPVAGLGALYVCSAASGLGLPCLLLLLGFVLFFFFFPFLCPCCLRLSEFSGPGCLGPGRLVVVRPRALFFFFCAPLSLAFVGSQPGGALGLGALWSFRVALFFACFFFPPPPPPPPFFLSFFFSSPALVCRLCSFWAGLCVLGCGVCWCVLLCRWVLPGCARSVCVVACRVAVWWCVLWCAWCCVGCLCWAWFLLRAAAPCCRLLVPCRGPWLCSVLGCGAALLWCAASRAMCCCGAVLFRSRWLVMCGDACGCWLFAAGSGCLPLFPAGVCCRGCSCLAAWLAALLCAVVCCGAPLPCAVSCILWCFVAVWCRAVAPCCPFSFAGGVGMCLFPVCAVLCCAARRVVRCQFGLRCCWCLVLWRVAVSCGVSLGVLRCGGAALACRGVLLCRALPCGVLRPGLCPAVL